jgi:16S rRNA (guanine966-N2)-methyltransferase|tara:strand:+ start:702 stop:1271 length:570 start_codon:yes stop_codon:yes gene_type:complete
MKKKLGKVRVIGGKWRGTKLEVADTKGFRPTADRVKETLFNWLSTHLRGANCLDLFAGSGALGIEAISRGALSATLVECNELLVHEIDETLERLGTNRIEVVQADGLGWLSMSKLQFDIVFLDPPFDSTLVNSCLDVLSVQGLSDKALVYIECPKLSPIELKNWIILSSSQTKEVVYMLLKKKPETIEG